MAGKSPHGQRESRLRELAERQHAVVGRAQLLALGFGPRAIEGKVRRGQLHRLHRGVYVVGLRRVDRQGLWQGAILACGDGSALSHFSAAAAWGLLRGGTDPVHVTSRRRHTTHTGIRAHRGGLLRSEVSLRYRMPVTTVARTLFDLAEVLPERRLARTWEEADRLGLLRLAEVEAVCAHGRGRRALRPIRRLAQEALWVEPTRSPLEDRFLAFCHAQRLPPPQTNVLLLGREVDAFWPAARLIAELDGFAFHSHRAAFERDRNRDAALLVAGYRTLHVTSYRLAKEPDALAAQIRQLLAS